MSIISLNDADICKVLEPQFNNITVNGTAACAALTVAGRPVVGGGGGVALPGNAIQTSSSVTINNSTWTQLAQSAPLDLPMYGTQVVVDLQGYISLGTAASDVIDVYATYSKNNDAAVSLTPGSQISNACYSGCSCRVYGLTADAFDWGDSITLTIYAKCQTAATLVVGTNSSTWNGMFQY